MTRWFLALGMLVLVPFGGVRAADAEKKEEKKPAAAKKEVKPVLAVFRLDAQITESPTEDPFPFGSLHQISFKELITRLKKAGEDSSIKAVVLLCEQQTLGQAQIEEVREVIAQIRNSGKEVYAHADSLTMGQYVLLSGASRLSVVPIADLWITGLYGEAPYLRGLLDKLGVKPDFLTCGEYKSAAEIFMREGPSPAAEKMENWLLDGIYGTFVNLIAQGRNVDAAKVRAWIDNGPYAAAKGKEIGLIDAVESRQDFTEMLKSKYGKELTFNRKYGEKKQPELDLSSPFGALKFWADLLGAGQKKKSTKDAVGIVYVEGPILLGRGEPSLFGSSGGAYSTEIRKALDKAAGDDTIKAVVLRVDSPGGSAVASDIILDATKRVKAKKPFIVSMGNVAGSGGYYVSCGADTIYADASTITGSIGVVAGKLVTTDMWKKIGITFKGYKRGENADLLGSSAVFSPRERERMQAWMDDIYDVFKGHVVAIRGQKLKKPIDELAGGRVYTGQQALDLGLVDKLGSLDDAVKDVAAAAQLTDYEIRTVPEPKNFLEQLLEETSGGKDADPHRLGGRVPALGQQVSLVDLALPYLQHLDPQRVRLVKTALQRLQLVQQEGVILMMPEMRIVP